MTLDIKADCWTTVDETLNKTLQSDTQNIKPGVLSMRVLTMVAFLVTFTIASMIVSGQVMESRNSKNVMLSALDGFATAKKYAVKTKLQEYRQYMRLISSRAILIKTLAEIQQSGIDDGQREKKIKFSESILQAALVSTPLIKNISLHGLDGDVLVTAGELWLIEVNAEHIDITEAKQPININYINGEKIIQIKGALYHQGKIVGAIQIWIDANSMLAALEGAESLGLSAEAIIAFRNQEGGITLLRPLRDLPTVYQRFDNFKISQFPMNKALKGVEGVFENNMYDHTGQAVLAALRYLPESDIGLVVKIAKSELDDRSNELLHYNLLLGGIILAFAMLLGWVISHLLISPLHSITEYAKNFGDGDLDKKLLINTQDEFSVLANTLSKAKNKIHDRENELLLVQSRLHAVLENMLDGVFIINNKGIIQYCNHAASKILGYQVVELQSFHFSKVVAYFDTERTVDGHLENITMSEIDCQTAALCKDGRHIPVNLSISRFEVAGEVIYAGLMHNLSEIKHYEKVLKMQNENLLAANEELEQFAYIASHDLKSPLRAMDNLVEWIIDDTRELELPDDVEKNLKRLQERAQFMETMIKELLEYSRAGRSAYPAETVKVKNLVDEIASNLSVPEGIKFIIDENIPELNTQKPPLEMVLRNLMSNAAKHHDRDTGSIIISAEKHQSNYIFSVTDDGPGIDPAYHDKVFQIFQTLQAKGKTGNTGMGLALVKRVVENYGGSIQLVSKKDERGCCFSFKWVESSSDKDKTIRVAA